MATHTCPGKGCDIEVPFSKLACRKHWFQLPYDIRFNIWRAFYDTGQGSEAHSRAILVAYKWWQVHP